MEVIIMKKGSEDWFVNRMVLRNSFNEWGGKWEQLIVDPVVKTSNCQK